MIFRWGALRRAYSMRNLCGKSACCKTASPTNEGSEYPRSNRSSGTAHEQRLACLCLLANIRVPALVGCLARHAESANVDRGWEVRVLVELLQELQGMLEFRRSRIHRVILESCVRHGGSASERQNSVRAYRGTRRHTRQDGTRGRHCERRCRHQSCPLYIENKGDQFQDR